MFAKARYLAKIGSWTAALSAYDEIIAKEKTSTGKKIDATMEKAKIALFNMDTALLKDLVAEAKKLNEIGGDWDRRNRLKVYEAYYLLTVRDLKGVSRCDILYVVEVLVMTNFVCLLCRRLPRFYWTVWQPLPAWSCAHTSSSCTTLCSPVSSRWTETRCERR